MCLLCHFTDWIYWIIIFFADEKSKLRQRDALEHQRGGPVRQQSRHPRRARPPRQGDYKYLKGQNVLN